MLGSNVFRCHHLLYYTSSDYLGFENARNNTRLFSLGSDFEVLDFSVFCAAHTLFCAADCNSICKNNILAANALNNNTMATLPNMGCTLKYERRRTWECKFKLSRQNEQSGRRVVEKLILATPQSMVSNNKNVNATCMGAPISTRGTPSKKYASGSLYYSFASIGKQQIAEPMTLECSRA